MDVGEGGEVVVEVALAVGLGGIEDLEELGKPEAEVGAVFAGALDEAGEGDEVEDAGVFGKEAEEDADEEALQGVALQAAVVEGVV